VTVGQLIAAVTATAIVIVCDNATDAEAATLHSVLLMMIVLSVMADNKVDADQVDGVIVMVVVVLWQCADSPAACTTLLHDVHKCMCSIVCEAFVCLCGAQGFYTHMHCWHFCLTPIVVNLFELP
jgi:hypothetical protein